MPKGFVNPIGAQRLSTLPAFPLTGRDNSPSYPTLPTGPFASFAYGLTRFACPNEIENLENRFPMTNANAPETHEKAPPRRCGESAKGVGWYNDQESLKTAGLQ
jgi:hypothetical protein